MAAGGDARPTFRAGRCIGPTAPGDQAEILRVGPALQLPQEVFKFRPPLEGRREKIKDVAF